MISKTGEVDKKIKYLPLAFCPCLLVRWSSSSLVFQRHLLTTLISDLGLSTVHEKVSTGHLPRHVLGASFQGLSTGPLPRLVHSPQTTYQGLFRPPTKACPQAAFQGMSTGHLPKLVRSPLATYQDLSTGHLGQRLPKGYVPRIATGHLGRLVHDRSPSKACLPQFI